MIKQMKKLKINHKFFLIKKNNFDLTKLNNARTYIIDVDFSFKKPFEAKPPSTSTIFISNSNTFFTSKSSAIVICLLA